MLTEKRRAGKPGACCVSVYGAGQPVPRTVDRAGLQAIAGTWGRKRIASRILSSG